MKLGLDLALLAWSLDPDAFCTDALGPDVAPPEVPATPVWSAATRTFCTVAGACTKACLPTSSSLCRRHFPLTSLPPDSNPLAANWTDLRPAACCMRILILATAGLPPSVVPVRGPLAPPLCA